MGDEALICKCADAPVAEGEVTGIQSSSQNFVTCACKEGWYIVGSWGQSQECGQCEAGKFKDNTFRKTQTCSDCPSGKTSPEVRRCSACYCDIRGYLCGEANTNQREGRVSPGKDGACSI